MQRKAEDRFWFTERGRMNLNVLLKTYCDSDSGSLLDTADKEVSFPNDSFAPLVASPKKSFTLSMTVLSSSCGGS